MSYNREQIKAAYCIICQHGGRDTLWDLDICAMTAPESVEYTDLRGHMEDSAAAFHCLRWFVHPPISAKNPASQAQGDQGQFSFRAAT